MNHLAKTSFLREKSTSQIAQKHARRRQAIEGCLRQAGCQTDEDTLLVVVFALIAKSQGNRISSVHRKAVVQTLVRLKHPLSTDQMRAALDSLKDRKFIHQLERNDTDKILSLTETGCERLKKLGLVAEASKNLDPSES